jgi:L-asparaginase
VRVSRFTLISAQLELPALVIHGGAGAYLKTTSAEQRGKRGATLEAIVRDAYPSFDRGARAVVLAATATLERDPTFNAGRGSRLQRDGVARLSAALMDGQNTRMSAVYNVQDCLLPSELCDVLQSRGDRNLDGEGARLLMHELGVEPTDVREKASIERWKNLLESGDTVDREAAIGSAGEAELDKAREARLPIPKELESIPDEDKYGTVGAVAADPTGALWACTSTGGRGHESVGRVSDTPTATGNYACPLVAISATGFGEQIIDLNLCGRIATRMLDGANLEEALCRTFEEVADFGGLLGVIAIANDGAAAYAHTTEACGVAWMDATGEVHRDQHGRG